MLDIILKHAEVDLSGHRVVRSTSSTLVNYADSGTPAHLVGVLGITLGAARTWATLEVMVGGELFEPSWSWTPDQRIYCGLNGVMTQVVPTAAGGHAFLLPLGWAESPTAMFVNIGLPIALI